MHAHASAALPHPMPLPLCPASCMRAHASTTLPRAMPPFPALHAAGKPCPTAPMPRCMQLRQPERPGGTPLTMLQGPASCNLRRKGCGGQSSVPAEGQSIACAGRRGRALQAQEGERGGRAEDGGGAADDRVVDAAALQVQHRVVQRHKCAGAGCAHDTERAKSGSPKGGLGLAMPPHALRMRNVLHTGLHPGMHTGSGS
jgi:hypothetical protein